MNDEISDFMPHAHVLWLSRSPDLNPVNYKIRKIMQEKTYRIKIYDVDELRQSIIQPQVELVKRVIDAAINQWRVRLATCIEAKIHFNNKSWKHDSNIDCFRICIENCYLFSMHASVKFHKGSPFLIIMYIYVYPASVRKTGVYYNRNWFWLAADISFECMYVCVWFSAVACL